MDGESLGCLFVGFVIGVIMGIGVQKAIVATNEYSVSGKMEFGRYQLWEEAVAKGYADRFETEEGKPAYRWKER